ncbi:MAG: ISAs1 family transposase [Nostoc sp.]
MPTGFENKKSKTKASFAPSVDSFDITSKFQEYFTIIKDPRVERTRWHSLTELMLLRSQKSIAEKIIAGNADYILSLKDNHPTLHQQLKNWFETAQSLGFKGVDVSISQRVEKAHHRIENRKVYTVPVSQLPALHEQNQWVGLTTVVMVVRSIQHWNKTTHEVQFYITSHGV